MIRRFREWFLGLMMLPDDDPEDEPEPSSIEEYLNDTESEGKQS